MFHAEKYRIKHYRQQTGRQPQEDSDCQELDILAFTKLLEGVAQHTVYLEEEKIAALNYTPVWVSTGNGVLFSGWGENLRLPIRDSNVIIEDMKRLWLVFVTCLLVLPGTLAQAARQQYHLYDSRRLLTDKSVPYTVYDMFDRVKIRDAIRAIRVDLKKNPGDLSAGNALGIWLFALWRRSKNPGIKRKVARLGLVNAERLVRFHPDQADGYIHKAIFLGTQAISEGVLNVLNVVTDFLAAVNRAQQLNPDILYGAPEWLKGRFLFKLPPAPVSIGNLKEGRRLLRSVRRKFPQLASTYLFLAESLLLDGKTDEALKLLDDIKNLKPDTFLAAYLKETSLLDAQSLRAVIKKGWDRFAWDPFLTVLPPPSALRKP